MKKKLQLAALVLSTIAVLGLSACGNNQQPSDQPEDPSSQTVPVAGIAIGSVASKTLKSGETLQLNAIVAPSNASDKTVTWTSSDPSAASVDANGLVTALEVSETKSVTITAKAGDKTATILLSVKPLEEYADGKYHRQDDAELYEKHLGEYADLAEQAKAITDDDLRFVAYAKAEANLLDSTVMNPTTTQGGTYAMTRVAPRTIPYAMWGNDDDRLGRMVAAKVNDKNAFITSKHRETLIDQWKTARGGGAAYNPKAQLQEWGYELLTDYTTTFSTAPVTLDIVNTSSRSDTEILVNLIDGLVEYDNLGALKGRLAIEQADGKPYTVSEDGLTYTFQIRNDAYWVNADGNVYEQVTADDFVAAMQHMMDTQAGLEYLVDGVIVGASEYLYEGGSFDNVGIKADGQTLTITLVKPESFFPTRLTYSCFMPMNRKFFLSRGGAFGIDEFKAASADENYSYGLPGDLTSMVYNGAFVPVKFDSDSEIKLEKNKNYVNKDEINYDSLTWIKDAGENPEATYNAAVAGTYSSIGLGAASGNLERAKNDGNFDKYHYISDTTSTSYMAGYNLNRGTFETGSVVSSQTDAQKIATHRAMNNKNFRKALAHSWKKEDYNAISTGAEVAKLSIRNMYTAPDFVSLSKDVTFEGETFRQGSTYGDLVQHYIDKVNGHVTVADGVDGWYDPEYGRVSLEVAKRELGEYWPEDGIQIDVVYYGASKSQTASANGYKQLIEGALNYDGQTNVTVNLLNAATTTDFYACGYRAKNGESGNFDVFYGSGWGPDYGDPSTYLDTFLGDGFGYMTKIIGLF